MVKNIIILFLAILCLTPGASAKEPEGTDLQIGAYELPPGVWGPRVWLPKLLRPGVVNVPAGCELKDRIAPDGSVYWPDGANGTILLYICKTGDYPRYRLQDGWRVDPNKLQPVIFAQRYKNICSSAWPYFKPLFTRGYPKGYEMTGLLDQRGEWLALYDNNLPTGYSDGDDVYTGGYVVAKSNDNCWSAIGAASADQLPIE